VTSVATPDAPETDEVAVVEAADDSSAAVAGLHIRLALIFLLLAALVVSLAALGPVFPDLFSGVEVLSYGRLVPVATNLFFYGWLTLGFLGAIYYVLPKTTGVALRYRILTEISAVLLAVGVIAGAAGVGLAGQNQGLQYLEMPLWADVIIAAGLFLAFLSITSTLTRSKLADLGPVQWFMGAAPIWLLLSYVVGNVPGVPGVTSTIQESFYRASLFGLWFAAAGLGIVYYLLPALTGRDTPWRSRLSVLGFWSVAFVWAVTGPAQLTYSAAPDWLETIGVVFTIGLILPVAIIFTDILGAMRGRWGLVADRRTLRFVIFGAALFALVPVLSLVQALRSSAAIVGFTGWASAVEWVAVFGAFTFWLFALIYHSASDILGGAAPKTAVDWHYALSVVGLVFVTGALLSGGLISGLAWVGIVNGGEAAVGEQFAVVVDALEPVYWVQFAGVAIYALGQLVFAGGVLFGRGDPVTPLTSEVVEDNEPIDEAQPISVNRLRWGAVGLFAAAVLLALVLPAVQTDMRQGSRLGDDFRSYDGSDVQFSFDLVDALGGDVTIGVTLSGEAVGAGRRVYLAEGCFYCHTQEVRNIVTDVGLGSVSLAGDYANEVPSSRGVERLGPDLMHFGARTFEALLVPAEAADPVGQINRLAERLSSPRTDVAWSTMPDYSYLTVQERQALATYLLSLQ